MFDIPMNLHCSQTQSDPAPQSKMFDIPMNLHCSQTLCYAYPLSV